MAITADVLKEAAKLAEEREKLEQQYETAREKFEQDQAGRTSRMNELEREIARLVGQRASAGGGVRRRAPQGQNRDKILAAVRAKPGSTASEISKESGITSATVYSTVRKMVESGALAKEGSGYRTRVG